jgi:hypothetical protein
MPALGAYVLDSSGTYVFHHVTVLTLRDEKIDESRTSPMSPRRRSACHHGSDIAAR